jgi:hypothetical protein
MTVCSIESIPIIIPFKAAPRLIRPSQYMMVGLITTSLTITTVKIANLVLYPRIFPTPAFKQETLIVGIAYIAWLIVVPLTNLFQHRPFNAAFDPDLLFTDS